MHLEGLISVELFS